MEFLENTKLFHAFHILFSRTEMPSSIAHPQDELLFVFQSFIINSQKSP